MSGLIDTLRDIGSDLADAWNYIISERALVGQLFLQHLQISLITLLIALAIALPLGILLVRRRWLATPVLGLLSIIYTIPSLALLILFIPFLGLGQKTAITVLVIYAQVVLVRNVVVGLQGIDPILLEAARGMGMNSWQRWWRVEFPLALPIILAGVRVAAVMIIGIAAIASQIAAGGLGQLLFQGISLTRDDMIWAGALAVGVLALAVNGVLLGLERALQRDGSRG
jgi:osmoprotectant transport system permease protein